MTQKQRMYAKIMDHGVKLQQIFPDTASMEPVALCKRLHRLEVKANRLATDYCNGLIETANFEKIDAMIEKGMLNILGKTDIKCFYNHDPRGYALKIDSEEVLNRSLNIERDWGGYGILSPEFNGK